MVSFSAKPTVLYLTSRKAFYSDGVSKGALDWNGRDFGALFSSLKTKIRSNTIRIILGNDSSYIIVLNLPKSAKSEDIIKKANELIPEEITASNSSFTIQSQSEKDGEIIQVFAIPNQILHGISEAALANGISVEYLCSVVSVLSFLLPQDEKPALAIYSGEENLAMFAKGKIVYGAENISENSGVKIAEFLDYVKDRFSLSPKIIYSNAESAGSLQLGNIETKKVSLDPYAFVSSHSVPESGQSDFLTLGISSEPAVAAVNSAPPKTVQSGDESRQNPLPASDSGQEPEKKEGKSTLVWEILLVLIILSSIGFFVYQFLIKK